MFRSDPTLCVCGGGADLRAAAPCFGCQIHLTPAGNLRKIMTPSQLQLEITEIETGLDLNWNLPLILCGPRETFQYLRIVR